MRTAFENYLFQISILSLSHSNPQNIIIENNNKIKFHQQHNPSGCNSCEYFFFLQKPLIPTRLPLIHIVCVFVWYFNWSCIIIVAYAHSRLTKSEKKHIFSIFKPRGRFRSERVICRKRNSQWCAFLFPKRVQLIVNHKNMKIFWVSMLPLFALKPIC
jgi:hypothetical protein